MGIPYIHYTACKEPSGMHAFGSTAIVVLQYMLCKRYVMHVRQPPVTVIWLDIRRSLAWCRAWYFGALIFKINPINCVESMLIYSDGMPAHGTRLGMPQCMLIMLSCFEGNCRPYHPFRSDPPHLKTQCTRRAHPHINACSLLLAEPRLLTLRTTKTIKMVMYLDIKSMTPI